MFKSVLVADKDVDSRDRFYEILFSMGHKVECAPNGNEALARLETERPYLLVLEEGLPPEGGLKTLEKIRKFDRQIKVVFVTSQEPDIDIETKAHRLGVIAVVKKDFSTHFMFKAILESLRQADEKVGDDRYLTMGKILVVDDTPEMRVTLSTFLSMKGFAVRGVASAQEALLEIKTDKPVLVLLDERMPGMDGLMALKKIKEIDSKIKVVMLTAVEDEDVMEEAKKLGALDYIIKPFDLEKLEALILSIFINEKYKLI
jgi:two-component system response regulator (stage 0 sporulation protein F)